MLEQIKLERLKMDLSTIILFNLTFSKVGTSVGDEGYIAIGKAI